MTVWNDVKEDKNAVKVLDHGFVVLMDVMGDDASIAQAARCSYGKGTKSVSDDRNLIRYLMRHHHTSPIEMVELKFLLKMPIFCMRQHVRHRTASLNEYSGRYSEMTDEMYIPAASRFQAQSANNKQASGDILDEESASTCEFLLEDSYDTAFDNYKNSLAQGLSRELARIQLPVANYTECYWKIDLKNFLHYVYLRNDPHAQYEIRVFAEAMYQLVKPLLPITCEAFEDYWCAQNVGVFSRQEMALLKRLVSKDVWNALIDGHRDESGVAAKFELSKREMAEFIGKLGL